MGAIFRRMMTGYGWITSTIVWDSTRSIDRRTGCTTSWELRTWQGKRAGRMTSGWTRRSVVGVPRLTITSGAVMTGGICVLRRICRLMRRRWARRSTCRICLPKCRCLTGESGKSWRNTCVTGPGRRNFTWWQVRFSRVIKVRLARERWRFRGITTSCFTRLPSNRWSLTCCLTRRVSVPWIVLQFLWIRWRRWRGLISFLNYPMIWSGCWRRIRFRTCHGMGDRYREVYIVQQEINRL